MLFANVEAVQGTPAVLARAVATACLLIQAPRQLEANYPVSLRKAELALEMLAHEVLMLR